MKTSSRFNLLSLIAVGLVTIFAWVNAAISGPAANVPAQTPGCTPDPGLVAYYTFDGNGLDSSGNGNNSTFVGSPGFVTGHFGSALALDGTSQYAKAANSASLNPSSAITISAWAKATDWAGNPRILQKGADDTQYRLTAENGLMVFHLVGVGTLTSSLPSIGTFHIISATYNGSTMALYVDGALVSSESHSGSISVTSDPLTVGAKNTFIPNPNDVFNGSLDEVRLYSRALSATEVRQLFEATSPCPAPTPNPTPSPAVTPTPMATPSPSGTPTPPPSPTPLPSSTPVEGATLLNIATRLNIGTADDALIGGFIVTGALPKRVLIRATGPSLPVDGKLADPTLELHKPDGTTVFNDNWRETQESEIVATGIPPTNDLESAIVTTLPPGAYTAIVSGKNGDTGVGLVESYDLNQAAPSSLANISTRGRVQTGDNVMIGGFITGGTQPSELLIRGIGPSLTQSGVPGALPDPTLDLYDGNGNAISSNDNWRETQESEISATGIAPTNDLESAILATLAPGPYTAIVRGKDNTTGVALVEVYNLSNSRPNPQAYAWDLSDQPGFFGTVVVDATSRYVAIELVEKADDGTVIRPNAGMHFVDQATATPLLLVIGQDGYPSRIALGTNLDIEFLSANPTTLQVTWQVKDPNGNVIVTPRTDTASADFFALGGGVSSLNPFTVMGGENMPVSRSIGSPLWSVTKATVGFLALAAVPIKGSVGVAIIATATVFFVTLDFAQEVTGNNYGGLYNGLSLGIKALGVASLLEGVENVIAAGSNIVSAEFVAATADLTQKGLDLERLIESQLDTTNDPGFQALEPSAKVTELIRREQVAQNAAGFSVRLEKVGTYVDRVIRRDDYFLLMNQALTLLDYAQEIIDNEISISDPQHDTAQAALDAATETLVGLLVKEKMSSEKFITFEESELADAQSALPGDQKCCNSGGGCCDDVAYDQLLIETDPGNILVLQGVVQSLTLMIPP